MTNSTSDGQHARQHSGIMSPRSTRSRTHSLSSDRPSTNGYGLASPPLTVSPEAAFIAGSAASQIVTNDHDSHADVWYDESGMTPAGDTAVVSYGALQLVNNFLDQLLFHFLQVSQATSLAALRPAVTEILKPKLAKDAINNADEELQEYLGGGDEDDYVQPNGGDSSRDWDLELAWKRTRLRCMVYSSLGDMEEEDEDLYMEQENLDIGLDENISDIISPAVAIFLTSVLEYMGELTLTVAGQAAYHRIRSSFEKDVKEGAKTPTDVADRVVVEEGDMERVALDRTLGRLWRGWKKRIRTPGNMDFASRPYSRVSMSRWQDTNVAEILDRKAPRSERGEDVKVDAPLVEEQPVDKQEEPSAHAGDNKPDAVEETDPKDLPLPMGDNDVNEIEIPGLAYNSEDEEEEEDGDAQAISGRPKSFLRTGFNLLLNEWTEAVLHEKCRARSVSLPIAKRPRFLLASSESKDTDASNEKDVDVGESKEEDGDSLSDTQTKDFEHEGEETATLEKAEIVTSSRVSVASSGPSNSEGGRKRSGSVHSARIVEVSGPKSPRSSPSPSTASTERARCVSVNGTVSKSATEAQKTKFKASESFNSEGQSPNRKTHGNPLANRVLDTQPGQSEAVSDLFINSGDVNVSPRSKVSSNYPGKSNHLPSSAQHSPSAKSRISILTSTQSNGANDDMPLISPVRSQRQSSKSSSVGRRSVERTRTRESNDDHPPLPIHSNAPPRPIHTSGSTSSSATGRLKAFRTSEDAPNHAENVARNFEQLIHSNQTITYTLTPENMRGMDSPRSTTDSPVLPRFPRSKTEGHSRSRSSSNATEFREPDNKGRRPSAISLATTGISIPNPLKSPLRSPSKPPVPPKSPVPTPKSPRFPNALARDARIPRDSTADFAEFIKSTGPVGDGVPAHFKHSHSGSVSSPTKTSFDSRRMSSASNKNRYQPREASVEKRKDNSDLIDFIRQGPPSSASGQRIPKHVAPFRNTMDSEHMSGAIGGRAVDATIPEVRHSMASTHFTENSGPSMKSSINSNTALLRNRGQGMPSMFDEDDMMPRRKTHRNKDPYAIDLSDEEDDDFPIMSRPPVKKEESLAEFLRNYNPPPEPVTPPVSQYIPKKKASAPSLMTRFTRNKDTKESKETNSRLPNLESRSLNSRTGTAGSKGSQGQGRHIPIQVSIPSNYDTYGSLENSAGRPLVTSPVSSDRIPMKRFEPRDAGVTKKTGTSDLAAFLRDSEPPPSFTPVPERSTPTQESGGFSKMFGRRRRV